jgi:hypothetical protein
VDILAAVLVYLGQEPAVLPLVQHQVPLALLVTQVVVAVVAHMAAADQRVLDIVVQ